MSNRKFILNSVELGRVTLADDPEGWDTVKKIYSRNFELGGVFRKRTASLKFVGDGLTYCVDLFELKDTEAVMNVIVMQKKDYEDAWELEYEGIGKFNPFDLEWDNDLSPSVSIEFEDSGFHNKFITRLAMMVNIGDESTIEGLDIGPAPIKQIQVHQRIIQENNTLKLSVNTSYYDGTTLPDPYILSTEGHVVPSEKISGDTDFITTPIDYLLAAPGLICEFVTQRTALTITNHITATGNLEEPVIGDAPSAIHWYLRVFHDSSDLNDFTDTLLHEQTGFPPNGINPFSADFSNSNNIQLEIGEAFTIVCFITYESLLGAYTITYTLCDVEVSLIQNFDEYVSNCHYRYEFIKRLTQIITDQEDCFKSDIFGRTDIGYPVNGAYYNNVVFNGKQLRGLDSYPVWSVQKTLKSVRSIWNVGCGIEKIGGRFKVVIEDLPYFFRGSISITLHNVTEVKRRVGKNFTFSEVRVGYEKAEYEQVNGLEEYNNKSTFATFIKSDENVLNLISPERADGYGMEFARRKSKLVAASEDTTYDQEVFTLMVNEGEGGVLRSQKDENYDSVDNIQSSETATNLDITPQRNLLRNGDWIKGCTNKYPTELLKFISADKETDLKSTRIGDAEVMEQTSVLNSALLSSLWLNRNYLFEAAVTNEQIVAMELKPFDLIKFSPFDRQTTRKYYYGWVLEVSVGGKDKKGQFTLLAANVISDRLHIVDPEGVYTSDPTTPVPPIPSVDDFGFEYDFEHVFES